MAPPEAEGRLSWRRRGVPFPPGLCFHPGRPSLFSGILRLPIVHTQQAKQLCAMQLARGSVQRGDPSCCRASALRCGGAAGLATRAHGRLRCFAGLRLVGRRPARPDAAAGLQSAASRRGGPSSSLSDAASMAAGAGAALGLAPPTGSRPAQTEGIAGQFEVPGVQATARPCVHMPHSAVGSGPPPALPPRPPERRPPAPGGPSSSLSSAPSSRN